MGVWNLESDYLLNVAVFLNTRPILKSDDDEGASIRFTIITRSTRIAKSIYLKGRFVNAMVQSVKMQNSHILDKCARLAVSLNSLCRGLCVPKRMEFWRGFKRKGFSLVFQTASF